MKVDLFKRKANIIKSTIDFLMFEARTNPSQQITNKLNQYLIKDFKYELILSNLN